MKSTVFFVLLLGAGAAYFWVTDESGINQVFNPDIKVVEKKVLDFMEDIQFKDFTKAATYHSPDDQKKVDIPKLLESKFHIKPEQMDLKEFNILKTSIDSTGNRARAKVKSKIHVLSTDKIRNVEMMLYFHKNDGQWFMELESSL